MDEIDQALLGAEQLVRQATTGFNPLPIQPAPLSPQAVMQIAQQVARQEVAQRLALMPVLPGPRGEPGEPGRDGFDGNDGAAGKHGRDGKDGRDGKTWKNVEKILRYPDTRYADSGGSSLIGFLQSGSGAVARTVQAKERDWISVKDFGAVGDGVTNDASAIQAAINYANTIGATLYFPAGVYSIGTTTLTFKNKVRYVGSGKDTGRAVGTLISYTGTGDAIQINNPINSSTAANISIEDLWVHCTARTAGKAAIADVGSTYLTIKRVGVSGNDYGIILDQSELADIDECDIELTAASSTAGVWLVNGAEHSGGANTQYTNRISIKKCQFNSAVGGIGIIDDGGVAHAFEDNNYNGCTSHIRSCGGTGISIRGGESEGATGAILVFSNLSSGAVAKGASIGVEIGGAIALVPSAGQPCISITSVGDITFGKTYMGNTAVAKVIGTANANTIIDTGGIYNAAGGATFDGYATRHFELNPSITLAGTATRKTNWQELNTSPTNGFGYGTGAGGTQSQSASKSTTVVLNTITGEITMNGAALGADTTVSFTLTNSAIASGDHVIVQHVSAGTQGAYNCTALAGSGSATVNVRNVTPGSLSEAIVLKFTVIKAATS